MVRDGAAQHSFDEQASQLAALQPRRIATRGETAGRNRPWHVLQSKGSFYMEGCRGCFAIPWGISRESSHPPQNPRSL